MQNIKIREAQIKDKSSIIDLIKSYSLWDEKYAVRYYDCYFTDNPIINEDLTLVAEINDKVVGVIGYCENYFDTNYAYCLNWFAVADRYRGWQDGSIAHKLLETLEMDLRRYRIKKIFVTTGHCPERCHGFYLKHGFQFEARLKDYYGKGEDQIIFGKDL